MDADFVSEVMSKLKKSCAVADDSLILSGFKIPLARSNFQKIIPANIPAGKSMVFIDGGESYIFESPSFTLSLIRIYHSFYKDDARSSSGIDEFYAVCSGVSAGASSGAASEEVSISLHPVKRGVLPDAFFSIEKGFKSSADMKKDSNRPSSAIRRLAELSVGISSARSLSAGDAIIFDGDLSSQSPGEAGLISLLMSISAENALHVFGISKTSSMVTSRGLPVSFSLGEICPEGPWHYPLVSKEQASCFIGFVKLHPSSKHLLRLDSLSSPSLSILHALCKNSADPVFLGYPYGLIEADRFARVSDEECGCLKAMLFSRAGKDAALLRKLSSAVDAHDILDNIS